MIESMIKSIENLGLSQMSALKNGMAEMSEARMLFSELYQLTL